MAESFTDRMQRVTQGLQTLAKYGAPESDVQKYMDANDVTAAHLRQYDAVLKSQGGTEKPSYAARLGRGITDIASGVGQITGTLPQMQSALTWFPGGMPAGSVGSQTDQQAEAAELADVQRYEAGVGPGIDLPRVAGQAIGTAPLAVGPAATAGLLARTAAGVGAGALGGGVVYAKTPEERMANAAIGGAAGGLFGAAAPAIAKGAGKIAAKAGDIADSARGLLKGSAKITATVTRNLDDAAKSAGVSLDDLGAAYTARVKQRAAEALRSGAPFDYDAAVRQARAEKFGFTGDAAITRGQSTRDPAVFSMERNLAKRPQGAALAERANAQLAQAEKYLDDLARAPDLDPVAAGDGLRQLSKARADALQADVRTAYQAIPDGGTFPVDALANRTSQIVDDFEDHISAGVKRRIGELTDGGRVATMDELIKLDKLISDTMPPGENAAVGTAASKLKKAVLDVMDDAADSQSSDAARSAYQAAKKIAAERFEKIGPHNGLVSQLVHGKVDPTKVADKVMTGGIDDLRRLKTFMMTEAERGPVNRWETIKRMVENKIQEEARPGGQFGQAAYDRIIKKIGKARLTEIFGDQKAAELIEFRDVGRDLFRYPNFHTINTSNTAPEVANVASDLAQGLADLVPGGRLASGLLGSVGKGRAAAKAERETMEIVAGLLSGQPRRLPRPNPALPALPYIRAGAPTAGLLAGERARQ